MSPLLTTVLFLTVLGGSLGTPMFFNIDESEELFLNFVEEYNRTYSSVREVIKRFRNFKNNLQEINELNEAQGEPAFGITNFADMGPDESNRRLENPFQQINQGSECPFGQVSENVTPPSSLDFRNKNVLSPVKDQGDCSSCWAFSTVGVVETKFAMKYSEIINLSEQQLVDCDKADQGCNGGFMTIAMQYIVDNGVVLDSEYPYVGHDQSCQYKPDGELVRLTKCEQYNMTDNEESLTKLLVEKGPLSFAIYSGTITHYKGNYIYKNCPQKTVDHAVILVGYGTGEDSTPYWVIRNSRGTSWGDKGYMRLRKGANECNMLSYPFTSAEVA